MIRGSDYRITPDLRFAEQLVRDFRSIGATGPRAGYLPAFLSPFGFFWFGGYIWRVENQHIDQIVQPG